jgi:hypothetical protein
MHANIAVLRGLKLCTYGNDQMRRIAKQLLRMQEREIIVFSSSTEPTLALPKVLN